MENDDKAFGFWIYLMTDLIIFAVLFATYVVLQSNTFGGPSGRDLFELPAALFETLLLLTSSFTCSLVTLAIHRNQKNQTLLWLGVTALFGFGFLALEFAEFSKFIHEGAGPEKSGFLSSFFALVATHGFHVSIGLLWMLIAILHLYLRGLVPHVASQLFRLAYFWHFLDIVWIFIFTIVYGASRL